MKTLKFRPGGESAKFALMSRRKWPGCKGNSSFRLRFQYAYSTPSQRVLGKAFGILHARACHSPEAVRKQFRKAHKQFRDAHFAGRGNASIRFLNKYTCHSWM